MQKSKMAILGLVALALIPSMGLAFATTEDDVNVGINIGKNAMINIISGGLAGAFLSTVVVLSKQIQNEANKQPDPKKYVINVLIGAISAVIVGVIPGINQITGHEALPFGTAFALLFFIDMVVRPIFGKWQIARSGKSTK